MTRLRQLAALIEHDGPGPHPSGSPQGVHGGGGAMRPVTADRFPRASTAAGNAVMDDINARYEDWEAKDETARALSEESGVSYNDCNRIVAQWAQSANDTDMRSLQLQKDASDEFGIPMSAWQTARYNALKDCAAAQDKYGDDARRLKMAHAARTVAVGATRESVRTMTLAALANESGVTIDRLKEMYIASRLLENRRVYGEDIVATVDLVREFNASVIAPNNADGWVSRVANQIERELAVGPGEHRYDSSRPLMESSTQRNVLRAMYNLTQRRLAEIGADGVTLYRGTGPREGVNGGAATSKAMVRLGAMSSWAVGKNVAKEFAKRANGYLIRAHVPKERILSFPTTGFGCLNEDEMVVLGGDDFLVQLSRVRP